MDMNMKRIDNVQAYALEPGDNIEFWVEDDSEEGTWTLETVLRTEDEGTDILIYTEEQPDEPRVVDAFEEFSLFGYTDEEE